MVAGTGIGVYAETLAHHPLAVGNLLANFWLLAPLEVQHAFTLRNDDLGAFFLGGQRLPQGVAHLRQAIGIGDRFYPLNTHAANRLFNRVVGAADRIDGFGRQQVLPAGGRRIAVVHHHQHAVGLVKHRIADAAGQPVMPEATVAHDRNGAFGGLGAVERRRARPAQSVTHGGGANVEGRQDGKQVTADVAADVVLTQLAFYQLHRSENWALRAAGAKRGRPGLHFVRRGLDGKRLGIAVQHGQAAGSGLRSSR